jgi:hypothetical protein
MQKPVQYSILCLSSLGKVVKNRHLNRREYLRRYSSDQNPVLLERAAGSEDAFDAAVSALIMARHVHELEHLPEFPPDSPQRIEGCIWTPEQALPAGS